MESARGKQMQRREAGRLRSDGERETMKIKTRGEGDEKKGMPAKNKINTVGRVSRQSGRRSAAEEERGGEKQ